MTLKRDGGSTVDEEAVGHFNGANSSTRNEIEGLVGRDRLLSLILKSIIKSLMPKAPVGACILDG